MLTFIITLIIVVKIARRLKRKKKPSAYDGAFIMGGATTIAGLYSLGNMGLEGTLLSLGAGMVVYWTAARITDVFRSIRKRKLRKKEEKKIAAQRKQQTVQGGEDPFAGFVLMLDSMRELGSSLDSRVIRYRMESIAVQAERLLGVLREHPDRMSLTRRSLKYYLDTVIRLGKSCRKLEAHRDVAGDVREKIHQGMLKIEQAIERQRALVLESGLEELDIELQVLEKTIRMEDL